MPTDLTGTPTSLGIGTYNVDADAPSGLGFNAAMGQIDALIAARATVASPAFTGTPTAPTPTPGDVSTKIATTSFVSNAISALAPLASPAFTGTPSAPTPVTADNTTKIATTAFVKAQGYLTSASAVASFNGRTGAVVPTSGDYTAAQITNAADKASGVEQDFASVIQAPNFFGVGPTGSTDPGIGGTFTPQAGSLTNWVSRNGTPTITIANPAGVAGGTSKVAFMAITYSNTQGVSQTPTITWDTAYRFGGSSPQPGTVPANSSYTWFFLIDMPQSRVICLGSSNGTWT